MENAVNMVAEAAVAVPAVNWGLMLSLLGALIAVVLGGLGSSLGIRIAGQKAAGVLAEKPHLFGSLVVLTALPGSQGIYGLLIAILILSKIGAMAGKFVEISVQSGWNFVIAGLIVGVLGFSSALLQGKVVASAIGALARDESVSGGAIILSVLVETYAIFGLLIAIFIWLAAL
jgi:V/A-type H+-transporting ATPase subunit K